jgi:hypothetical protein
MGNTETAANTGAADGRNARKRALGFTAATAIALIALLASAVAWAKKPSAASRPLDAKLAQLRADGVPLTADELAEALPDPDSEHDAHIILRDAFAVPTGSLSNGAWKTISKPTEACSETAMQSMQMCLATSDTLLEKIPDRLDRVWFSMAWTNGFTNLTLIRFTEMRELMQTLAVKAVYEAERGNSARSAEALRQGFAVTGTINPGVLMHTMTRVGCNGFMCDAAERILNRVRLSDSDLSKIQRCIDVEGIDNFDQTFMVERCTWTSLALEPTRRGLRLLKNRPLKLLWWKMRCLFQTEPYRDEDYLMFLNVMDEHRAIDAYHRLSGLERIRRHEQLDAYYDTNVQSSLAVMVMPNWSTAMRTATRTKARLTALAASLAVERYRLANNALPDTLDALIPRYLASAPRDPMDNQPLRYKRLAAGYVLYSIGTDGIDNGRTRRATAPGIYDITFTIEK